MITDEVLKEVLILDIECWSDYDIKTDFERYVNTAKPKWIGFYSYKSDKYYEIQITDNNRQTIIDFIQAHRVIVTHNGDEFDIPILKNNQTYANNYKISLDLLRILKKGKRANQLGFKFKSFSLKNIAKDMGFEVQKGDIDYRIFKQDSWTAEEEQEIKTYLRADIEITKQIFEYMYHVFKYATDYLSEKNIKNWSWMNASSGSFSYKILCHVGGFDEKYGDYDEEKTESGGLVIEPTGHEFKNVWYKDFSSLYPSIIIMLNMLSNPKLTPNETNWFTGNDLFKIKGKYGTSEEHKVIKFFKFIFFERRKIKKENPHKAQFFKIMLNAIYGLLYSSFFKTVFYEPLGDDVCSVGRTLNVLAGKIYLKYGFESVFGDTDSRGLVHQNQELSIVEQRELLAQADKELLDTIKANVPFPFDGLEFESETGDEPVIWMGFNYSKTKRAFKKKNYMYVYKSNDEIKVKATGLPIVRGDSTELCKYIYNKHIKPRILKEQRGKFEETWVRSLIQDEVNEHWDLLGVEYRPNPFNTYKSPTQLQAQISLKLFNGGAGNIVLYKNNKIGKVGTGSKYCTYEEAIAAKLRPHDFDLSKIYNELEPFVKGGFSGNAKMRQVQQMKGWF